MHKFIIWILQGITYVKNRISQGNLKYCQTSISFNIKEYLDNYCLIYIRVDYLKIDMQWVFRLHTVKSKSLQ